MLIQLKNFMKNVEIFNETKDEIQQLINHFSFIFLIYKKYEEIFDSLKIFPME